LAGDDGYGDLSRFAAARGYDAVRVTPEHYRGEGFAGADLDLETVAGQYGIDASELTERDLADLRNMTGIEYAVLNRSALVVDVESSDLSPHLRTPDRPSVGATKATPAKAARSPAVAKVAKASQGAGIDVGTLVHAPAGTPGALRGVEGVVRRLDLLAGVPVAFVRREDGTDVLVPLDSLTTVGRTGTIPAKARVPRTALGHAVGDRVSYAPAGTQARLGTVTSVTSRKGEDPTVVLVSVRFDDTGQTERVLASSLRATTLPMPPKKAVSSPRAVRAPDTKAWAAHIRGLDSPTEVVEALDSEPALTPARLRELADELGLTVPAGLSKVDLQLLIARRAPRGGPATGRPAMVGRSPFDASRVATKVVQLPTSPEIVEALADVDKADLTRVAAVLSIPIPSSVRTAPEIRAHIARRILIDRGRSSAVR
jgi:hypothetical protein